MTSRERVKRALRHEEPDRVPIHDEPWEDTVARWREEGLPEGISPEEYFGYEFAGFSADLTPRLPTNILEKHEEHNGGARKNFLSYSPTPEVIDYPVKNREDWEKIKDRLYPDYARVDWASELNNFYRAKEKGEFITYRGAMGYDLFQSSYMETEKLLMAMVQEPDWIKEMFRVHAELLVKMAKIMMEGGFEFDGAFLGNDMGCQRSSLFSPRLYRELLMETDMMVCDFFHGHGMPVILHSCGNVRELIPCLIEAGFDCLQPLEVKAGMDLIELKREYGDRLSFMGGIDVRLMKDARAIEEEIRTKFAVAKGGGGYIYHSDHSVPNDVSFENYKLVMELAREYGAY